MRDYIMNFNQELAIELKEKYSLAVEDIFLLRRLADFTLSTETIEVLTNNNEIFYWINYKEIQKDTPLFFTDVKSLKNRIFKLSKKGLLKSKSHIVKRENLEKSKFSTVGTFSILKISNETKKLFDIKKPSLDYKIVEGNLRGSQGMTIKKLGGDLRGSQGVTSGEVNKEYQEKNTKKEESSSKDIYINSYTEKNQDSNKIINQEVEKKEDIIKSSLDIKAPACSFDDFIILLKPVLRKNNFVDIATITKSTAINIFKNCDGKIEKVKKAIIFIKTNNKKMGLSILIAILRDKDYLRPTQGQIANIRKKQKYENQEKRREIKKLELKKTIADEEAEFNNLLKKINNCKNIDEIEETAINQYCEENEISIKFMLDLKESSKNLFYKTIKNYLIEILGNKKIVA